MTEKNPQVTEKAFIDDDVMSTDVSLTIPNRVFFRIGEVSRYLGVSPSVVRYWETEFKIINPERSRSGQRLYRRKDLENLALIKKLLYEHRFTLEGAKLRMSKATRSAPSETTPSLVKIHRLLVSGLKEIRDIASK